MQYSPLLPPWSLDRVSVPVWLIILSRPARDRRLGEPLLTFFNPPRHPDARGPKVPSLARRHHAVLAIVSNGYPTSGQFLGITHPSARRRYRPRGSDNSFPLDLHVLGLPPAFNLSHDQTLQFKILFGSMNTEHYIVMFELTLWNQFNGHFVSLKPNLMRYRIGLSSTSAHTD